MKKIITLSILTLLISSFTLIRYKKTISPLSGGIVVIVNIENPVNAMTAGEVKLMWMRKVKKRWPDFNKNIKPVDRKNKCPERDLFYSKVLNMTADEVDTYFMQKQYQNAEKPQDKFSTDADVINFIIQEPGAIGFVNASSIGNDAKVKVVLTLP